MSVDDSQLVSKWQAIGALLSRPDIKNRSDAAVMWWLCERADKHGVSYPSLNRLARDCGLDRSNVIRALDRLLKSGLVEIAQQGTRESSTRHRVRLEAAPKVSAGSRDIATRGSRDAATRGGGDIATEVVATSPPEPSHEPAKRVQGEGGASAPGAGRPASAPLPFNQGLWHELCERRADLGLEGLQLTATEIGERLNLSHKVGDLEVQVRELIADRGKKRLGITYSSKKAPQQRERGTARKKAKPATMGLQGSIG